MSMYMRRNHPKRPSRDELRGTYRASYGKCSPRGDSSDFEFEEDEDGFVGEGFL